MRPCLGQLAHLPDNMIEFIADSQAATAACRPFATLGWQNRRGGIGFLASRPSRSPG